MKRRGILVVVSGFSGAGKGTLMKNLLKTYDNYALSISMTTRQPRKGGTGRADRVRLLLWKLLRNAERVCGDTAGNGQGCAFRD